MILLFKIKIIKKKKKKKKSFLLCLIVGLLDEFLKNE